MLSVPVDVTLQSTRGDFKLREAQLRGLVFAVRSFWHSVLLCRAVLPHSPLLYTSNASGQYRGSSAAECDKLGPHKEMLWICEEAKYELNR